MADTVGSAFVALRSDDSQLQSDMETQLAKALGPVVAKGAKILAGLFVGKEVLGFAREGIAELAAAEKQSALTGAQLKATGEAAGISQTHIEELAAANLALAGTGTVVSVSAERVLLQFSRITAVGGIFDETLHSAQDLAIATGQDLPSAARSLGLALQDPIHATRLLRAESIPLNDAQQAQIKAFQESGNILGAQRIILDAVAASVGGVAATYGTTLAGDLQRAQEELKNTRASLVEGAAPALMTFADLSTSAAEAIQGLPIALRTTASTAFLAGSAVVSLLPTISTLRTNTLSVAASKATLAAATAAESEAEAASTAATVAQTEALNALIVTLGGTIPEVEAMTAAELELATAEGAAAAGGGAAAAGGTAAATGFAALLAPVAAAVAAIGAAYIAFKTFGDGAHDVSFNLRGAVPSIQDFTNQIKDGSDKSVIMSGAQVQVAQKIAGQSIPAARNYNEALRSLGLSTDEVTAAIDKQERANLAQTAGSKNQTVAEYEQAEAERLLMEAQTARFGVITASVTAERALERSSADVTAAHRSAAAAERSLTDAQKALTEARKGASAEDITKSELSLESAQIAAVNSAKTVATEEAALQRLRSGMRGTVDELASAEDRLNSAREAQRRANQSLEELERTARINARRGIELTHEQQLAINDARISAADAAKNTAAEEAKLADLRRPATAEELATQEQKLEQARIANQTAIFAVTDAEKALQDVQAQGTESDQKVIDARQRVADAAQNLADANGRVTDSYVAQADAVAAQKDAQDALNGVTQTAATRASNLRNALAGVLNQFAPGSQERQNIEDEIVALDKLLSQQSAIKSAGFTPAQLAVIQNLFGTNAATGFAGTVTSPTTFFTGENNRPEDVLIVPHSQGGIPAMSGGGGVVFGPGAVVVQFHGAVPSAAEAFRTGQAVGAGVADTLEARQVRLARKIA